MDYITHHDFKGDTLSGLIFLHRGDILTLTDGKLYYDNRLICIARSYNGKQHFARNDDGNGLERGDISYAIAYGERNRTWTEETTVIDEDGTEHKEIVEMQGRFTPEEIAMIERDYPQFDKNPDGVLLFSDEFFTADIETLRELAGKLDIHIA